MNICQLADLGPTAPLASSRYVHDLSEALEKVLEGAPRFTHFAIVHEGASSIRLFLQGPLEGAVDLPHGSSTAFEAANELIAFAKEGARYSDNPPEGRVKGWSIRAVTIGPKKAAIAEATRV